MGVSYLFESSILNDIINELVTSDELFKFSTERITIRPLSELDFHNGYLQLLGQLTEVGDISENRFIERFLLMKSLENSYYIVVIVDNETNKILACGTLNIEFKFIHQCTRRGRIEEIVVDKNNRGNGYAKIILKILVLMSKKLGCYKLSLDCKKNISKLYESVGFEPANDDYSMRMRF